MGTKIYFQQKRKMLSLKKTIIPIIYLNQIFGLKEAKLCEKLLKLSL